MNPFEQLNDSELAELKKVFYSQAYEILEEIQDSMLKLEADPGDVGTLKVIQRCFHTLKGDSNSLGLTAVGTLCHRVEDVLAFLREQAGSIDADTVSLLLNCADHIDHLLRMSEAGGNDIDIQEILKRVDAFLEANAYLLGETPPQATPTQSTEYQQLLTEKALVEGVKLYDAEIIIHPLCAEKGIAAYMICQRLNSCGQIIYTTPDIDGEEIEKTDKLSILFSAALDPEEIKAKLFITGITAEINIKAYTSPAPQEKIALPEKRGETALSPLQRGLLRIEVSKVDKMMNLVGELIIGRSIIDQIAKDLSAGLAGDDLETRLLAVNAYVERTVSDLQRGIMKMRMVPINHAFRKFPKEVRDLAVEKNKPVRLEISGRETELDKSIVDAIGEPLAHIIRNCFDHGIEEPAGRKAQGKPEEGLIILKAYQEAAQIVIEVADDGKGIDVAKLKQKALQKGILAPAEAEKLTEAETVNLIFHSGLSTSEIVSETSGRGIGMDAVRTVVHNLKGSIEVESKAGKGTRFRLRLPLTLAVIKALLFKVGEKLYAIPIAAIVEVARVMPQELTTIEGKDTLKLRDRIISILRLDQMFKIMGKEQQKKFVLIIGIGSKKVGLMVDHLLGQQELVVKAIDSQFVESGLVAGASILGNGRVVLILDAVAIFKKAIADERRRITAA
jgi:two-component system chemotaxis sensor kinase CheA